MSGFLGLLFLIKVRVRACWQKSAFCGFFQVVMAKAKFYRSGKPLMHNVMVKSDDNVEPLIKKNQILASLFRANITYISRQLLKENHGGFSRFNFFIVQLAFCILKLYNIILFCQLSVNIVDMLLCCVTRKWNHRMVCEVYSLSLDYLNQLFQTKYVGQWCWPLNHFL